MTLGHPRLGRRPLAALITTGTLAAMTLHATEIGDDTASLMADHEAFLSTYCIDCHGPEKQKGDRRLDELALPITSPDTLHEVQDIIDVLVLGDMPPEDAKRHPDTDRVKEMIDHFTALAADGHTRLASTGRETVLRRLNRREYLNTVGDLFDLNMTMFDPTLSFPRDQMVEHMDNIGDTLRTSGYLLDQYIAAADLIVEKALGQPEPPAPQDWHFRDYFYQQPELRHSHTKVHQNRFMVLYEGRNSTQHEGGYGPLHEFAEGVPADGYYHIRVLAEALNREHPYDQDIFGSDPAMPFRLGIVPGRADVGPLHEHQPIEPLLGEVVLTDNQREWYDFRVWLDRGHTPRFVFPNGALTIRLAHGRVLRRHNELFPEEVRDTKGIVETRVVVMQHGFLPQIRIHEVKIHGPMDASSSAARSEHLLNGQPLDAASMRTALARFASRAYRRPAQPEEVDRLVAVADSRLAAGHSWEQAFRDALKAALCSPAFIYLNEPAETEAAPSEATELDAFALASRLSYFLWSTMPDDQLFAAAADGSLLDPPVLRNQTRRLLANPRSNRFVAGFLDAWLNLRALGDMPPDRETFSNYYAQSLEDAMKTETRLFTRDLIDRNESAIRFLDADYTLANRPLARLYGDPDKVSGREGHTFQRITFDSPTRGGLLGQAAVLTVTANGVETSPVTRGVWVLESILGTPPAPPPDDVPAIDPDIRGAKSMREILAQHRDNPACYDCHRKIDPPGFALESFDPIGAWRTHYHGNLPIDTSGELTNGDRFEDVAGLKLALLNRQEQFARNLTTRLLAYACGRRMEPLDRPAIDGILARLEPHEYPLRDLIEAVVLSEPFRTP